MITLILALCVTGLMAESAQRAIRERRRLDAAMASVVTAGLLALLIALATGAAP